MLRTTPDTHYAWVAGSCDYAHEERYSGGAYIMQLNDKTIESYAISDDHTTEFRMILSVMIHAMHVMPADSDIVFLTNYRTFSRTGTGIQPINQPMPTLSASVCQKRKGIILSW